MLLSWMMSLISFSYWLKPAPRRSAFIYIINMCICTLYTHNKHTHLQLFSYSFIQKLFFSCHPCSFSFLSTIHPPIPMMIKPSPCIFSQNGNSEAEELVYSHYVICNDTHETLRFGQVDTDENVLLASLHSHQYSWRSRKSPPVGGPATPPSPPPHTHTHTHTHAKKNLMARSPVVLVRVLVYLHIGTHVQYIQRNINTSSMYVLGTYTQICTHIYMYRIQCQLDVHLAQIFT